MIRRLLLISVLWAAVAMAQGDQSRPTLAWSAHPFLITGGESPQNSGYRLYRQGYVLVLDNHWAAARAKFAELLRSIPGSVYRDDAEYWSAYALMHLDQRKALDAYRAFLRKYRESPYMPDAVADLAQLEMLQNMGGEDDLERPLRDLEHHLRIVTERALRIPQILHPPPPPKVALDDTNLDQATRLRIEAVAALSETKEDDSCFAMLRHLAENSGEARPVRFVAMNSLSGLRKHDPLPVFVRIARSDTSMEIQLSAISLIRLGRGDRNRKVESLEEIFRKIPEDRLRQRIAALYAIAEVGNDRAVDFLAQVARENSSVDLRSDAIFYLGNIGTARARAALFQILRGE
jgi:HEAT repeat protein